MAGIKDVAKMAGVGVGTVSRVINNSGYVAEATREKVEDVMKTLNYTPNELARNLYRKKTGIVAVLVPDSAHPFFAEFVRSVEMELYHRGYKTMICNTDKVKNSESEYLQMLRQRVVDGVITGVHSLEIAEYLDIERPIVALDRFIGNKIPVVSVDHKLGGRLAAEELIKAGCREIIQFQGSKSVQSPSQERHTEFERIINMHGITLHSVELGWNKFETPYYEEIVSRVFGEYSNTDGVFGADLLALEYMKVAQEQGKRIPEDLKVICYDGTFVTDVVSPPVTIIRQPIEQLAQESVRLIDHMINGKEYKKRMVEFTPELIRRKSTL
ncbi:LacI family DNA-binding transcriptional regulator [Faecalicatena contorta]|uniref:Transcriptional regulator, LacI family n=1 Tax=Faecalicatena contorta TaxID=39482 RepID=A0A315ZRI9_9FIRM|nr:LacI family DNA-binding transcriptional regulator [Faecalicatena contorta]PWJ47324.1 LacI family transcriptional regulator [Faecalicatena contorta]SUQ16038.1 transcriptional regulator, LacI family [Faecalicatena contorta]